MAIAWSENGLDLKTQNQKEEEHPAPKNVENYGTERTECETVKIIDGSSSSCSRQKLLDEAY